MDHQDDRSGTVQGVCIFIIILSTVTLLLRFVARYVSAKAVYGWDDWLALSSFPFILGVNGITLYWVSIGLGKHVEDVTVPMAKQKQMLFAVNFVYNTGLSLIKLSVVLFYARVLHQARGFKAALWITGVLVIGWGITFNVVSATMCIPVEKNWNPTVPGHCNPETQAMIGATTTNVLIDIIVLVLPLPAIWKLHLRKGRKAALIGVFASGYCVALISIVRVISIVKLGRGLEEDFTYNFVDAEVMICVEIGIALWSSSLPSIYQLGRYVITGGDPTHSSQAFSSGSASATRTNRSRHHTNRDNLDTTSIRGFHLPMHSNVRKSSSQDDSELEAGSFYGAGAYYSSSSAQDDDNHHQLGSSSKGGEIQVQHDVTILNERNGQW